MKSRQYRCRFFAGLMLVLLSSACSCGCARSARYRPVQLTENQSVIYVYRRGSILSPGRVSVLVDQRPLARLGPNRYAAVIVSPGEHLVRAQRNSDAVRRVVLGAGESVYLQCSVSLIGSRVWLVKPDDQQAARRAIAATRRGDPYATLDTSGP